MTDEHEIKITTNSTRDPLPCALAPLRLLLPKSRRQKKRANQRLARFMDDQLCVRTEDLLFDVDRFATVTCDQSGKDIRRDRGWQEDDRTVSAETLDSTPVERIRVILIEDIHHRTTGCRRVVSIDAREAAWVAGGVPVNVRGVQREPWNRSGGPSPLIGHAVEVQPLTTGDLGEAQSVR